MKIAVITPRIHKSGGTEKLVLFLVDHLRKSHEVHLFTSEVKDFDTANMHLHKLPIIRKPAFLGYLCFLFGNSILRFFRRLFKGERFDLVLSTSGDVFSADVIYSQFCQKRRLRDLSSGYTPLLSQTFKQKLRKAHIYCSTAIPMLVEMIAYRSRRLKLIVCAAKGTANDIRKAYDPKVPLEVCYNCVDLETYNHKRRDAHYASLRKEFGVAEKDIIFLFVGGDWERKGVPNLLRAFSKADFADHIKLWIVGNGDHVHYRKMLNHQGFKNIELFLPTDSVWRFFSAADFFIFPSYYDPFPVACLEALACGLPSAISGVIGTAEILKDGDNALIIDNPMSEELLIATMKKMLAEKQQMTGLGMQAAKLMNEQHSPEVTNSYIEKVIDGVLHASRPGG